jgi:nicotinate-nucleotide adenylyltransferase
MKVALFGGSFDPPHHGHIALARLAIERLGLDRVLIAPVGAQPFKGDESSPFADRVAMVRLALANQPEPVEPRIELSLVDAPHPDGSPNYTVDAVHRLRGALRPGDSLSCLMGADSFLTIGKWRRAQELLLACDFIVASRPGFDLQALAAALPEKIILSGDKSASPRFHVLAMCGEQAKRSHLYLLPDLAEDISATGIRAALRAGREAPIDPAVAEYIRSHRLYQPGT